MEYSHYLNDWIANGPWHLEPFSQDQAAPIDTRTAMLMPSTHRDAALLLSCSKEAQTLLSDTKFRPSAYT